MALGISRTHLGGVLSRHGIKIRVGSSSRYATCSTPSYSGIARAYGTASASLTKKSPVTAKGTINDSHRTAPPPKRKRAGQVPPKKSTSPEMEEVLRTPDSDPVDLAAKSFTPKDSAQPPTSEAEKLKEMDRIMAFQHLMPTIDTWGQEVKETLDVMIPLSVNYKSVSLETFHNVKTNILNRIKNAAALSTLMTTNSLPGVTISSGFRQQFRQVFKALGTQSVEPDAVLAPVRRMVLDNYQDLNHAIASRNEKEIKKYSTFSYQTHSLDLARSFRSKNSKGRLIWQMHRTIDPVQILSLRVTEGYLAPDQPRTGSRMMVHALIKFDTEQSLEMYSDRGVPLHTVVTDPDRIVDSEKPKENWRVPAPRKRVTEYLVVEKRMWMTSTWQFREQMWPKLDTVLLSS
ncbi:hypothetical protein GALMADRAFT_136775 [Galerina marginata CBS 339.88]|uniref:Uncharacterized protein n=1 Tax=Galerina marginata (strain CBS 339.88) TaxID=685588 RepID=A0A067TAL2_GALM3|nr:hypothetical protein GALMADRAFT_136775 [Galerina marginata CBS 339.88]